MSDTRDQSGHRLQELFSMPSRTPRYAVLEEAELGALQIPAVESTLAIVLLLAFDDPLPMRNRSPQLALSPVPQRSAPRRLEVLFDGRRPHPHGRRRFENIDVS